MAFTTEQWQIYLDNAKKAAATGDVQAMKDVAFLIRIGSTGKEDNLSEAFPYYKQAADAGDAESAEIVGACYSALLESIHNDQLAFKYMKQAADKGSAKAQRYTGMFYSDGTGCECNMSLARQYLEKAALQNDGIAQWELFELIMSTRKGVDEIEDMKIAAHAADWSFLAYVNGVQEAEDFIKSTGMWGTPLCNEKIEEAKRKRAAMCGEEYVPTVEVKESASQNVTTEPKNQTQNGGCYIATSIYGSYDCPEVWTLRRFRDNTLAPTWYGRAFIKAYYAISPTIVKYFGNTAAFQKFWHKRLDRLVERLHAKGVQETPYRDMDF